LVTVYENDDGHDVFFLDENVLIDFSSEYTTAEQNLA
jgi:hypothetical protein